ncbi:TetR/AcrR family transcriptional regulator [Bacillus sp. AK128]
MKKQLIMENALELFSKQGIEATSVQQITEHCNISKGAFYLSFKSKNELVLALIDHFMSQFISDIDYVVRNLESYKDPLYKYYYVTFESFLKHSDFVNILLKEKTYSFSEELLGKMQYYDHLSEKYILTIIEEIYGDKITHTKYDLLFCIKGFTRMYHELFLFYNYPVDLELLSNSLVEKTNLIAGGVKIPFVTEDSVIIVKRPVQEEITKEQIHQHLEKVIAEIEDHSVEKESLILLKDHFDEKSILNRAIIKGLLENIRNHPHCKWISYLLRNYFEFK